MTYCHPLRTVVIVFEQSQIRNLVAFVLRQYGYAVVEAQHGKQALSLWEKHQGQFDMLLTDMVMPESITGRELAEKLQGRKKDLAVIIASGYSEEHIVSQGKRFRYIPKPFETNQLAKLIREVLDAKAIGQ